MINAFQMNTAMNATGLGPTGNGQASGTTGESLFGMLLNSMGMGQETDTQSLGASLFTQALLSNMTGPQAVGLQAMGSNFSINNAITLSGQGTTGQSDLSIPESAVPDLVSFLGQKGFTDEQIDNILLSSRNDQGLIQINKLVKAMQSAKTGTLSDDTDLSVDEASVPKVQALLFNMGMGVGEVAETVERSKDETGGISLDKLTAVVNEQLHGTMTKTEMASLLAQNDVSVTSQPAGISVAATAPENIMELNARTADNTAGRFSLEGYVRKGQGEEDAARSVSMQGDAGSNSDASVEVPTASGTQAETGDEAQAYDINRAARELKKEFTDFVDHRAKGEGETAAQKTVVRTEDSAIQSKETTSVNKASDADNALSTQSKTVAGESTYETSHLNRALSKEQTQWQKGDQGKIIDILKGETQASGRVDGRVTGIGQDENIEETAASIKQTDQRTGQQDVMPDVEEARTKAPVSLKTETSDVKDGLMNIRETQAIDTTQQNMSRVTEDAAVKTQTSKGAYNIPDPTPRVFERMVIMVKNGEQTGRLMIQPPELGKIDIDLSIKNGHIQANLSTENIAVKEIIEANLNQLKQQLHDQGLIVEQFNVSVGSQNRQFMENFGQGWNQGYGTSGSGGSETEDVMSASDEGRSADPVNNLYRIDVRV